MDRLKETQAEENHRQQEETGKLLDNARCTIQTLQQGMGLYSLLSRFLFLLSV